MNLFQRKSRAKDFAEITQGMTNEEMRQAELDYLQPEKMKKPDCPDPCPDTPLLRYVKVYFSSMKELEEFSQYIPVKNMQERTTRASAKIVEALRPPYAWTTTKPTKAGWYFKRDRNFPEEASPVHYTETKIAELAEASTSDREEWAGPIYLPD